MQVCGIDEQFLAMRGGMIGRYCCWYWHEMSEKIGDKKSAKFLAKYSGESVGNSWRDREESEWFEIGKVELGKKFKM